MSTNTSEGICPNQDPEFTFRFVDFNPRRRMRGVEAARVEVIVDGVPDDLLWMSEKDIRNNLEIFGEHAALRHALDHYTGAIAVVSSTPQPEAA
jgi:hypothetical protein